MKNKETLKEAAQRIFNGFGDITKPSAIKRALKLVKWQQEQDKNKYSEEEVLNFTQTILMQYKLGNTNIEQLDLLKETLQQF